MEARDKILEWNGGNRNGSQERRKFWTMQSHSNISWLCGASMSSIIIKRIETEIKWDRNKVWVRLKVVHLNWDIGWMTQFWVRFCRTFTFQVKTWHRSTKGHQPLASSVPSLSQKASSRACCRLGQISESAETSPILASTRCSLTLWTIFNLNQYILWFWQIHFEI